MTPIWPAEISVRGHSPDERNPPCPPFVRGGALSLRSLQAAWTWLDWSRDCPRFLCLLILVLVTGCSGLRNSTRAQSAAPAVNPVFIAHQDQEYVWERVVDVVHDYFEIARENRLDGIIETKPLVAAGILEPWHRDSVGLGNRLEGSLQSIRRRGFVNVLPAEGGGYLVSVEIFKEQEDVVTTPDKSAGNSTFQENRPLQRDLSLVVGDAAPEGWIALGHDQALEAKMLREIQLRIRN